MKLGDLEVGIRRNGTEQPFWCRHLDHEPPGLTEVTTDITDRY